MPISPQSLYWLKELWPQEVQLPGKEGVIVPSGFTADRPVTPVNGLIRYNQTDNRLEAYENGAWGPLSAPPTPSLGFTDLTDTPSSYTGLGGQIIRVTGAETGVEFIDGDTLFVPVGGGATMTGNLNFTGGATITGLPVTPLSANEAVSKAYVDSVSAGLDPKESVRAATTGVLTGAGYNPSGGTSGTGSFNGVDLTGALTDTVNMNAGDRLLVKDQADPKQNGIYIVVTPGPSGTLERATDQDGVPASEVSGGNFTFIEQGTQTGQGWVVTFSGILTLNVHNMSWTQFSGAGTASLAGLSDTIITAPTTNSLIQYDGANWINVPGIPRLRDSDNDTYIDVAPGGGDPDNIEIRAADSATGTGGSISAIAGASTGGAGLGGNVLISTGAGGNDNSGTLTLRGADAVTLGVGGDVTVQAGTAAGNRRGGKLDLLAGNTTGSSVNGGDVTITAGGNTSNGGGGNIAVTAGIGTGGSNAGGNITLKPGTGPIPGTINVLGHSTAAATELRFYEASINGSAWVGFKARDNLTNPSVTWNLPDGDGSGGDVIVTDGAGNLSWVTPSVPTISRIQDGDNNTFVDVDTFGGDSNYLRLKTADDDSGFGAGGTIELLTGDGGTSSGAGGPILLTTGDGGANATDIGNGGDVTLLLGLGRQTGRSGNFAVDIQDGGNNTTGGAGGGGGTITLQSGKGGDADTAGAGNGGNVSITARNGGYGAGAGNGGIGGGVTITSGDGGNSLGGTGGAGGGITLYAGDSKGNQTGGAISLNAGDGGTTSGVGGPVTLNAGDASALGNKGGRIELYAGSSLGNSDGADIYGKAGDATSAGNDQTGGNVILTAGDGAGTDGDAGIIRLIPGSVTGAGATGGVEIWGVDQGGEIRLTTTGGGNSVGFKAPSTVTTPAIWQLPNGDGASGQQLITNGSEELVFVDRVYDVGSSIIGVPPLGIVWRFSVPRPFILHPSSATASISVAFCDAGTTAGGSPGTFELHLVGTSTGPAVVPGNPSPTNIGTITFAPAATSGSISTWLPGAPALPSPGMPVPIPPAHEIVLIYSIADGGGTLGNISFTFDGSL